MAIRIKRVYEPAHDSDGKRVLVDRLWPRGLSKADARIDQWLKEVAPSTTLRQWFGHDPDKWPEFRQRYRAELRGNPAFDELQALARKGDLTLVYGARDAVRNQAAVLLELLLHDGP
ncbi:MAG TPA: DUF488 domain-containing protein [Thiobacillaceae bacterium]|nr:DUF488 domain-containing protein [Thiobacillaceae bacterium]HNU64923.1 DUF488 domain-containing protein [Thiobacillaceae bacterium]